MLPNTAATGGIYHRCSPSAQTRPPWFAWTPPTACIANPYLCTYPASVILLLLREGRVLTEEEFEAEATLKYDGLSVEAATRGGRLEPYSAPPNLALAVLGTGLFAFLQGRIAETCRNVYPVNPGIVDEGLAENILRDSQDPGAVGVIAAGGKLPFSRSANEMLGKFGVRGEGR